MAAVAGEIASPGFTHAKPAEVAREALRMIGEHLRRAYAGEPATTAAVRSSARP